MATRRDFLVLLAGAPLYIRNLSALTSPGSTSPIGSMPDPVPGDLARAFANPPKAARPYVLWMWMGCNISKEGITRDLEAMKEAGIGGATIFSLADTLIPWAGVIGNSPTPEIVTWTEPWWAMLRHAASECRRLGLELILHNCAGYESSGGTWITPELAMQEVVWSERRVTGGTTVAVTLDRAVVDPHPHSLFPNLYIPALGKIAAPIVEGRKSYYRDIAVVALPAEGVATLDQVFDLSGKVDAQGELRWDAPAGEWVVYRFGHTTTGAMIQPAQWDAIGLECDKMSAEAVTFHVRHVLGEIKRHLGDLAGTALTTLYFDSYEAGDPTWTPKMREQFQARRGYDIVPWLPVLAGRTLGGKADTERFQADLQRTVKDLYRDCYWALPRALAHEAGLQFVAEPYTGPWEIEEVMGHLDHANMEFWTNDGKYSPTAAAPIADGAHEYGQRIMGAESFTTSPEFAHWDEHPAWLKPIGDAAFCAGVNRMSLHHFVQQPWGPEYRPGNAMGQWGVHFGRYQTWWEPGKAWLRYLWRCQTLLQTGEVLPASELASAKFLVRSGTLELQSIHRRRGTGADAEEIFFVANLARTAGVATAIFPVVGKQPELWDPVWGTTRDLPAFEQDNGSTSLTLNFAAAQSFFVVFRKPARAAGGGSASNFPALRTLAEIYGPWTVHFDPAWGGPATVEFAALDDWTKRPEPGIRYYSGTATYKKSIQLGPPETGKRVYLSLGTVNHLATVTVNGKRLGVVWTAPWSIDITDAAVAGENRIEIAVANVWANRLIGDQQEPDDCLWQAGDPNFHSGYSLKEFPEWFLKRQPRPSQGRYAFTTWNYFDKDSPLVPSGLLGPVEVMIEA
jgi:hypothetical protein